MSLENIRVSLIGELFTFRDEYIVINKIRSDKVVNANV